MYKQKLDPNRAKAKKAKSAQTIIHQVALIIQIKSRYHPIIIIIIVMLVITHEINLITKQVKIMQKIMIIVVLAIVVLVVHPLHPPPLHHPMCTRSNQFSHKLAQIVMVVHTIRQQRRNRLL